MELRDRDGLTEAEFLARYSPKDYPRPSLTVDVVLFARESKDASIAHDCHDGHADLRLLMIQRGGHPYLGCWALPGGFVNPDEDTDTAAARELVEETGVAGICCEQFGVYSTPGRDPRGWTVSAAYVACLEAELGAQAGDDAASALWCPVRVLARGDGAYEMEVQTSDEVLHCSFERLPARCLLPRAHVLASDGFAFDHAQIVADAWLALCAGGC